LHLPPWPGLRLRVAPYPAPLCRAGDEVSGCPESSVHWLCRLWSFELPRTSHISASPSVLEFRVAPTLQASCHASDPGLRLPLVPSLRLCRRWSFESPRTSHPSAVPTGRFPGCPESRSFGIADDPLSGLPRSLDLPAPADGSPSHLGSRTIRLCHRRTSGSPRSLFFGGGE